MRRHESDVCIIGSGITGALLAQKLSEGRPGLVITVVEAGRPFGLEARMGQRQRRLDYGENAWPGDFIEDQTGPGVVSRTMAVGGQALHWGAHATRFSEEDLRQRSLYGLAVDWPITWEELEEHYCEAERRIGVAGEQGPKDLDPRSEPYPMPPMPLTYNLVHLKAWADKSEIPFWTMPQAKNTVAYDGRSVCLRCDTCEVCPTGAKYSPDFTLRRLVEAKKIVLHDRTLVRRLELHDTRDEVVRARATREDGSGEEVEYEARVFVLAAGFAWSPHLLLLSSSSRFPRGLANRSGLVGAYMGGHRGVSTNIELDARLYHGQMGNHGLYTSTFLKLAPGQPYVRHDLKIMEGRALPTRLRDPRGGARLGDELLGEWRTRAATRGTAYVFGYYELHFTRESRLVLDHHNRNRFGDPLPRIDYQVDAATQAREAATREHWAALFARMARAGNGTVAPPVFADNKLNHPIGGCRMGTDPAQSVCDSYGQTHDHPNLFVVGASTLPTAGCTNGALTFSAVALRSAVRVLERLGGSPHRSGATRSLAPSPESS